MAFQAQQTGSIGDPPADASALAPTAAKSAPPRLTGGSKELAGRDEVVHSLELACEWIERNEPTNPAPLLIRRAQRLMNKNFLDIIRDLAPAGLPEVENIAGSVGS